MTMIGKIIGVNTQSIMRCIKISSGKFADNESQSNIEEIEVDKMVSYINSLENYGELKKYITIFMCAILT